MKIDTKKMLDSKKYCEKIFKFFLKREIIREDKSKLFEKHLKKALNNLEFANFLLEEHKHSIKAKLSGKTFYDWCVTIYYYAIYHTALALVKKAGFESKNHLATIWVITLFYYHKDNFLKQKDMEFLIEKISFNKQDIDFVLGSKEIRERACYGADELFELSQALNLKRETVEFINKVREFLG